MIDNHWYVGCASSQLTDGGPVGVQIGDSRIALFRDVSGRPAALLDRCCHRGMPLSLGALRSEGRIQCAYHGWEFDARGRCVRIPSQGADKALRFGVPVFNCVEVDHFVWVWIGDLDPAPATGIPEAAGRRWVQGSRIVRCEYLRALENLFDMCHVPFVHPSHPGTIRARQSGLVETPYELVEAETTCSVFTPPSDPQNDRQSRKDFHVRFTLPGEIRFAIPTLDGFYYMYFFVTPLPDTSCRIDWLITNPRDGGDSSDVEWQGRGGAVGDEDQRVLEAIQWAYEHEGEAFERSVEADAPTLSLRRIVRAAERGESSGVRSRKVRRRVLLISTVPRETFPVSVSSKSHSQEGPAAHDGRGESDRGPHEHAGDDRHVVRPIEAPRSPSMP